MTVFYPPHIEFSGKPEIAIYAPTGSEPSAVIHWAGGNEHVTGTAQADERIGIYLQVKEMLAAHQHAVACHAGLGEYVNGDTAAAGTGKIHSAAGWDPSACAECGSREGTVVDGWHAECQEYHDAKRDAEVSGLPALDDDGGDGDDNREPYCTVCLFTVTAAGQHMYPDGVLMPAHEMELGWREPVGRPVTQAGRDLQADSLAAEQLARDLENGADG